MRAQGLSNAGARLFSNPAGDYGSMVNERVGASNWEDGDELGNTWVSRNAFRWAGAWGWMGGDVRAQLSEPLSAGVWRGGRQNGRRRVHLAVAPCRSN